MFTLKNCPRIKAFIAALANPVVVLACLAIGLLWGISLLALRQIEQSQERVVRSHLDTSLNSFSELIHIWQMQNLKAMQVLVDSSQGKILLKQVLLERGENPATHQALKDWLYPVLVVMGFDGFSVINNERIFVAVTSEEYRGKPANLPETIEVLDKALARKPAVSRPVAAPFPLSGPRGSQPKGTLVQNMCVLFESEVTAPGYFCLRFNPQVSFFPIFIKGRAGASGEMYAIDHMGRFITPPRFTGAHKGSEQDAQHFVRLPENLATAPNQLTYMADALVNTEAANLISIGYLDYRGVMVAGAGRWFKDMGMGVIVEQDTDEAFAPYFTSRSIVVGLTASAIGLILVLMLGLLINRHTLAIREGRFRSLLNHVPAAIYMRSLDHKLIVVNPAFCELVRIHKDDLLGCDINNLPVPRWVKPLLVESDQRLERSKFEDSIIEVCDPAGNAKYFRSVLFPVITQGQEQQAVAHILVEATERVESKQRLATMNQQLEQLVGERTQELITAKDEALEASKAKADFLANMSHEIRTPLNAIIGLAHVALADKPSEKQRTYLEKMRGSGEHLLNLINDILNFSRMEAGKLVLDNEALSIEKLVGKVVDLMGIRI